MARSAPGGSGEPGGRAAPELRVYLLVRDLQRQFAAYLGTPTRARGYPPFEGEHSLIVEVAPALAIERASWPRAIAVVRMSTAETTRVMAT